MGQFIIENLIWVVPVLSIFLSILIKTTAKNSLIPLTIIDFLDFGFGLAITSITIILTNLHNDAGIWLLVFYFMGIFATANIVHRRYWNKDKQSLKLIGVIVPDILGVILLVVAIIYVGGGIT
ncbi:MAG: hypothetical protein FWE08_06335 [Oscillospiraceae bacterium]|nr:hypothetical protein [Oscillospiraceae bacterium]